MTRGSRRFQPQKILKFCHVFGLAFAPLFLMLFIGCGEKESKNEPPAVSQPREQPALSGSPSVVPADSLSLAMAALRQLKTSCEIPGGCNPAVGMVGVALPAGVGRCTGFLIAADIMATNSHCIPSDLKSPRSLCHGRIVVSFPSRSSQAADGGSELWDCAEVIEASDTSDALHSLDYAFFRLQRPTNRVPLQLNHNGFREGDTVRLLHVNPSENSTNLALPVPITEVSCRVARQTFYSVSNHDRNNPIEVLAHCPEVHGNSGAPVLAADGSVIGLFHQLILQDRFPDSMRRALQGVRAAPLVRVTSFACIRAPTDSDFHLPAECVSPETHREGQEDEVVFGRGRRQAEQFIEQSSLAWRRAHSNLVQWGVRNLNVDFGAAYSGQGAPLENSIPGDPFIQNRWYWEFSGLEPRCVRMNAVSATRGRTVTVQLPTWNMRWILNSILQSSFEASVGDNIAATLVLSPFSQGRVHVTLDGILPLSQERPERPERNVTPYHFAADLPLCSDR